MTNIKQEPNPPKPVIGGAPWHPESYFDLEKLDLTQLPIAEEYEKIPGYKHQFTVRLVDYPDNRDAIRQLLIRQFLKNPASSFLRETESGLMAIRVYQKEETPE